MKLYKICSGDTVLQELRILDKESLKKYLKSGTKIKFRIPSTFNGFEGEIVGWTCFDGEGAVKEVTFVFPSDRRV